MQIEMTYEQAQTHIAALHTHLKNQKRKLLQCDDRIAKANAEGDHATACHIEASKAERLHYIGMTWDELCRMHGILGNGIGISSR